MGYKISVLSVLASFQLFILLLYPIMATVNSCLKSGLMLGFYVELSAE